jgi:hypothetical protein
MPMLLAFVNASNQTSNRTSTTNQGPMKWAPRHDHGKKKQTP